jgi:hypothetical protein
MVSVAILSSSLEAVAGSDHERKVSFTLFDRCPVGTTLV